MDDRPHVHIQGSRLREALNDLWSCIAKAEIEDLQPETVDVAIANHDLLHHRDHVLPETGSRWVWEIDKPHARELIEVTDVTWNGEKWWVRTWPLLTNQSPHMMKSSWNDLARFWEAVTPVG